MAVISPVSYWTSVAIGAITCVVLCGLGRARPGPWRVTAARLIGLALAADAVSYSIASVFQGTWSAKTSLPLALCNVAVVVAAVACWWRVAVLVELTYFWGLAGTLQGLLTPDLNIGFPHLVFFEYVVGHAGIVIAALFLVVGMGIVPRPGSIRRLFTISVGYSALVGLVDAVAGANYMFLRRPPGEWTLLRLLGPWPWYLVSATAVALVLFTLLDSPFWSGRRQASTERLT
ncbi:MAG TPA: TIGR02206 family membrane protein [Acidimicrobiales bacterium]|nr:TIGR02206 family membrane protein [Acidimicrobiales bacterium]